LPVLMFVSALLAGGSILIEQPKPGEALQETQTFVIGYVGETPEQVDLFLNGRLMRSRRNPPFRFSLSWDTALRNRVRAIARWADGATDVAEQVFSEIETDVTETVSAIRCFPYFEDRPDENTRFRVDGRPVVPQTFESAASQPLSLVVALDVSGSMKFFLKDLSQPMRAFLAESGRLAPQVDVKLTVFDREARLLRDLDFTGDLTALYRNEGSSVVWDAVATAAGLFAETPRRTLLLISDGADDGSVHDADSAAAFLRKSRASLIWLAPSALDNRDLARLARRSGGFRLEIAPGDAWTPLRQRLVHQRHLVIVDVDESARLRIAPGPAWWPDWR